MSSSQYRLQGNEVLKSIDDCLLPVIYETRLKKCCSLYQSAIDTATNHEELSSAYKNFSVISFKLAKYYSEKGDIRMVNYYTNECFSSVSSSLIAGEKSNRSSQWLEEMKERSVTYLSEYASLIMVNNNFSNESFRTLENLKRFPHKYLIAQINFYICSLYYHKSKIYLENNIKLSYQAIKECYFYYQECLRLVEGEKKELSNQRPGYHLDEALLRNLVEEICVQEFLVEGYKEKKKADDAYDSEINNDEVDYEVIWDTIDSYREAILKTKDCCLELEAEILSKLGTIYEKILNLKEIAKKYYYTCLQLAELLRPKNFIHESWYVKCISGMKRFQDEQIKAENLTKEKKKESVIDKIKDDLEKIQQKSNVTSCELFKAFLVFVYTDYPPKLNFTFEKDKVKNEEIKKHFKTALIHYHPDKNSEAQYGLEWFFISEEISKSLGKIYEKLK